MADWATISSLATAGGTLVLAIATFASVRSANRSARLAEDALQEQRRPVLVHSRTDDRAERIGFSDGRWIDVPGGHAVVEAADGVVYLTMSVRNVGAGIAVLQAWRAYPDLLQGADAPPPVVEEFRALIRDLYVPSGDVGIWQGAVRDSADPLHPHLSGVVAEGRSFTLDLLYTDQIGGQRTVSRFGVLGQDGDGWRAAVARHWYLDTTAPR